VVDTETKLAEMKKRIQDLEQTVKEMETVLNHSFDGIYVTDGNGTTLLASKALKRISNVEPQSLLGKNMKELVQEGVFDASVTLQVLKEKKLTTIFQKAAGGHLALSTGCPVFDEKGNIIRVVTNVRALNEINQLREEVEMTRKLNERYHSELTKLRLEQMKKEEVVTCSKNMLEVIDLAFKVAPLDATVLILGESGVGKEIVADLIYQHSRKERQNAIVKINCSAIPKELLESELFGYEPGAFTGASKQGKPGMFELADQGTLFLDEVADLPLELQAKLLRVLQEQEITRIGSTKPKKINVRVIAATNKDLEKQVQNNLFRADLYYRLNVIPILVPPLRERKEDIPLVACFFLQKFNAKYDMQKSLSYQTTEILMGYHWPGNIRELRNLMERLVITVNHNLILPRHLPVYLGFRGAPVEPPVMSLKRALEEVEKRMVLHAEKTYKSTYDAAKALGISQPTMSRKLNKYRDKR